MRISGSTHRSAKESIGFLFAGTPHYSARKASEHAAQAIGFANGDTPLKRLDDNLPRGKAAKKHKLEQIQLLRDTVGNPFYGGPHCLDQKNAFLSYTLDPSFGLFLRHSVSPR
jgi:hypothetical protein